jgi:hypothetical protein
MNRYKIPLFLKVVFLIFLIALGMNSGMAQYWTREYIGESKCSAYFPATPEFDLTFSEDSSKVWTGEVSNGDIFYGVICVEFSENLSEHTDEEKLMVAEGYLDFLRGEFSIEMHTGYLKGSSLLTDENALGITDYWEDSELDPWNIQVWMDAYILVVMYMYGDAYSYSTETKDFYFDSFRFPE